MINMERGNCVFTFLPQFHLVLSQFGAKKKKGGSRRESAATDDNGNIPRALWWLLRDLGVFVFACGFQLVRLQKQRHFNTGK